MNPVQKLLTDHIGLWTGADTAKKSGRGRASGSAGAVYGIKKLRELILELAVGGKLVPQDPSDEPASALLERIREEKARLVLDGKVKKDKPMVAIEDDEKPFSLPPLWEWTTLAAISQVNPRNNADDNSTASFVPMTMIGTRFNSSHDQDIRLWKEVKQAFTHFADGDIGIAKITPCFENSKACVFSRLQNKIGAGTTELHIIRPIHATLAPRYVLAYLKSPHFLQVGETRMTGTAGQKRLPKEFVESNPFPLPPLAEQHRIVAKVDELMALCDRLEAGHTDAVDAHEKLVSHLLATLTASQDSADFSAGWQRIAAHFDMLFTTEASIDALKQTLLQLAVMGKLVPQDPSDEPASALLERIQAEKATQVFEGKMKKDKPLAEITDDEKPFALPKGWEWVRLGTIAEIKGGKRVSNGYQLLTQPTPYIYIRVSDMKNGTIDDSDLRYIDSVMREEISRYIITKDDLYMTIVGATIGKCGIVPKKFDQMNLTENAAKLTIWNGLEKMFIYKCLSGALCQNQFFDKTKQVGVQKMALNQLASTILPLPSQLEQIRIGTKVDELMALCDQMKERISNADALQRKLADVMVAQAVA